jgi:hypothetical protein
MALIYKSGILVAKNPLNQETVGLMMNRLRIRLGGPFLTAFLVNRMTFDLQNQQMG